MHMNVFPKHFLATLSGSVARCGGYGDEIGHIARHLTDRYPRALHFKAEDSPLSPSMKPIVKDLFQ
jgi:hypothetical protein